MLRNLIAVLALAALLVVAGCGSSGGFGGSDAGVGSGTAGSDDTLVWDQGEWDLKRWGS